jgi:hypothetical protein
VLEFRSVEVEELNDLSGCWTCKLNSELTFSVPSLVAATINRFSASVAIPQMGRSFSFSPAGPCMREVTSAGRMPILKVLRWRPDCMFHIRMAPVDVPASPKLPHAETETV